MNFISAEEFLKQPKEVQDIFINWWQPQMYDLFFRDFRSNKNTYLNRIYQGCIQDDETLNNATKDKTFLPLLTESQLRQFIEDKTKCKIELDISNDIGYKGYNLYLRKNWKNDDYEYPYKPFENLSNNLFQAYWQVACQIAQKEVNNQKQNIISTNRQGLPVIKGGGKTMREMYNEDYR